MFDTFNTFNTFNTAAMTLTFLNLFILLIIVVGIIGGIVALQIFLSKQESKWPGLILPIITFTFSFMAVFLIILSMAAYMTTPTLGVVNGVVLEQNVERITDTSSIIFAGIFTFLFINIPTAILLAIYIACRSKRKKQQDLEKMNLQDL